MGHTSFLCRGGFRLPLWEMAGSQRGEHELPVQRGGSPVLAWGEGRPPVLAGATVECLHRSESAKVFNSLPQVHPQSLCNTSTTNGPRRLFFEAHPLCQGITTLHGNLKLHEVLDESGCLCFRDTVQNQAIGSPSLYRPCQLTFC